MNAAEHLLGPQALARHGARSAFVCEGAATSYAELALQVRRAASAMVRLGVRPGDRVLLLLRDTPEFVAAWLGAVRAGAVAIGLNTKLSEEEYRHIREDSGARIAIVEDVFARARPDLSAELARDGALVVAGRDALPGAPFWRAALEAADGEFPAHPAQPEDPAFWLYSSGTTGKPKGIIHAHKDVLPAGQVFSEVLGLEPGAKVFVTSKLFFAYALDHALLGPLVHGLTSVLHPEWPEVADVCALVARERPAVFASVPSLYRRLAALPERDLAPFRGVRHFLSGGERLPEALVEQWRRATGGEMLSIYGMSETFCVCLVTPRGLEGAARPGKPLSGVATRLLTREGAAAPDGEPGVLWVKHPALGLGYANRPEQTRAQFQDGWFCTHDVFVRDARGLYSHQVRSDELVKIAGQYVQPGEIEAAVQREPSIGDAACVPVSDADGFERLALFVTARAAPAEAARAAELACEGQLPRYKRPRWIRLVDEIPRTGTGKVQRFRLREMLERELAGKR